MYHRRHTKLARGLAAGTLAALALSVPAAAARADDEVPFCGTVPIKVPPRWPIDPPHHLTDLLINVRPPELRTDLGAVAKLGR